MTAPREYYAMDDPQLIACARQGDRQAFGELVNRHQAAVVKMLYYMCGDVPLAEDAAQEAFIRVWKNLDHYKPRHAFKSWLYRIAANAALDSLRRERPAANLDSLQLADHGPDPQQAIEAYQRAELIRRAIQGLSPGLRLVLVLREYQELGYQEIADVLDIPVGTVMSRLNSARSQLRNELQVLSEET